MNDNILEKIKKLLALSHSDNEHEAARALAYAMKLARKYDIDLDAVKGTEFTEKIEEEDALVKAGLSRWEIFLFQGIAEEFGCRLLTGLKFTPEHKEKKRIIVVGQKKDRAIVIYLATYLRRCVKDIYKKNKSRLEYEAMLKGVTNYKVKQDYCYGAVISVLKSASELFKQEADTAENEASTALIQKKCYAVDKYIDDLNIRTARSSSYRPGFAILNGVADGKEISINRPLENAATSPIKQLS